MNTNNPSPPQKNLANPEMMDMIKRKGQPTRSPEVEKAKQQIKELMQQNNVNPDILIQIGKMAKQSFSRPENYQILIQQATQSGLIKQEEIKPTKNGMDLRLIAAAITIGKLAEMIKNEGM
jgi:hypothetical protein